MARARSTSPTRSDVVLAQIRGDVLNGRLTPGSRLGFADLGERYTVSSGVLREVLPRLVEQGLAESEPQHGFRVIDVSIERLAQLTDARVAIETLVIRQAVAEGDIAWESAVVAAHHALVRTGDLTSGNDITDDWLTAHEAFHVAVLSGCRNAFLLDTAVRLRSISEVYRCWSRPEHNRTHRDLVREHREIMEAAINRNADQAAERTEAHIRRTTELLIAGLASEHAIA
jgi:DNA-binding GntR family transcriptional regulator